MKIILHEIKNNDSNININNNNVNNNTVNTTNTINTTTSNNITPTSKEQATEINKEAFDRFIESIFNPFAGLVDYSKDKNINKENTDTFKIKSTGKVESVNDKNKVEDKKSNNSSNSITDNNNNNSNLNPFTNPSNRGYTQKYITTPNITKLDNIINTNPIDYNNQSPVETKSINTNSSNDNSSNNVDVNSVFSFLNDISRVYYNIEDCNKIIQKWKKADLNELNRICGLRSCNNGKYLTIDGINVATPEEIRNKYAENTISTHLMDYSDNYFQVVCSRMEKLLYALWMCKQKAEFYNNKLHQ